MPDQVDTAGGFWFSGDGDPADMKLPSTSGTTLPPREGMADLLVAGAAASGKAHSAKIEALASQNIRNQGDNS